MFNSIKQTKPFSMNKYILFQELRPFCKNFRTIANPAAGIVSVAIISESDFKARYMKMTKLV